MQRLDAILPAGGRISGQFAAEAGAEIKALIPLGERTVLEQTLSTLQATGRVGRTVVIGPEELTTHPAGDATDVVLPEGTSGAANIFRGLEWLYCANDRRHAERVLILTTDLPFLTPEALTGFLDACPADLDVCMPVVSREEFEARFSYLSAPYVRLRDGEWIIGCAFLVNPAAIVKNRAVVERVFVARKSHIRMAFLLGPSFIVRFLMRQLTVGDVEQRCVDILGCTGGAIRGCGPELAFDIDRREDYQYAVQHSS